MAKDPAERYQSCVEVLNHLQAYREGRPGRVAFHLLFAVALPTPPLFSTPRRCLSLAGRAKLQSSLWGRLSICFPLRGSQTAPRRWRLRDWAATICRSIPEFIKDLQNTTQQVDGAVAEHERRRGRLQRAGGQRPRVAASRRAAPGERVGCRLGYATGRIGYRRGRGKACEAGEEAGVRGKRRSPGVHIEEQQRQVKELEHQLTKADAVLARLCGTRDVLKARLVSAEARRAWKVTALY